MTVPRDATVIRLDSMIAIARAAERGLGVALVPVQLSDAWFESGSLVPLSDHELLTREDVQVLLERLRKTQPSLVGEVVPEVVSVGLLQRVRIGGIRCGKSLEARRPAPPRKPAQVARPPLNGLGNHQRLA